MKLFLNHIKLLNHDTQSFIAYFGEKTLLIIHIKLYNSVKFYNM